MNISIKSRTKETPKGEVTLFELRNSSGAVAEVSSLGAGVTRIVVPDRDGRMTDVVLGYEDEADYLYDGPCAGKTPGRYANRIANAEFTLGGRTCRLPQNDGPNSLHGGSEGFQNRIWECRQLPDGVEFSLFSPDGDAGYPGNLHVTATYRWRDDNSLEISYEARTDAPTYVNLTNHTYFNLAGCGNGDILSHLLKINASRRIQSDLCDIPTGRFLPVDGTPFDFRTPTSIGSHLLDDFENLRHGKGYNHYFLLDAPEGGLSPKDAPAPRLTEAAELYCAETGIRLAVSTDLPGVMLYTGNWLDGAPTGKGNCTFHDHDAVALECQYPPDAPHHPHFPNPLLLPSAPSLHTILFSFPTPK